MANDGSDPSPTVKAGPDDETLSDAIQSVFPMNTERAMLVWHGVFVPLGYKYDISVMCSDIVDICSGVLLEHEGARRIFWPSNTFASVWDVSWRFDSVSIIAQWHRVTGSIEVALQRNPAVSIPRSDFLAEWKRPLEVLRDALRASGYTAVQIPQLQQLEDLVGLLPLYGHLYRT